MESYKAPSFNVSIRKLASSPEFLSRTNGNIEEITRRLAKEGFKPFAISKGNVPLTKIVEKSEIQRSRVKFFDYANFSRKINPGEVYLIYKYDDPREKLLNLSIWGVKRDSSHYYVSK